jgi:hypothetical protein
MILTMKEVPSLTYDQTIRLKVRPPFFPTISQQISLYARETHIQEEC